MSLNTEIESVSMVDAIEKRIKDLIVSGVLAPGHKLPSERDLQEQLNVSRLPLREALARLQALGLINTRHGKGAFVEKNVSSTALSDVLIPFFPNFSGERLAELIEARGFLEGEIASLATQRATRADLDSLRTLGTVDRRVKLDPEALANADYAFHREIARIARNNFLSLMHDAIGPHIRSFIVAFAQNSHDRLAAITRNEQLAAAICGGDATHAAKVAREHLQPCLKTITAAVKGLDPK